MLFDLTEVLSGENKVIHREVPLELNAVTYQGEEFPVVAKTPVSLTVTHVSKKEVLIEAAADVTVRIPCDRCLADVDRRFHLSISRGFDLQIDEEARRRELDECSFLDGYKLDVDLMVFHEIILNWPMKILCREDCKGICRKCGKNLNEGACDCDMTELDPRMAKILDIFNNSR